MAHSSQRTVSAASNRVAFSAVTAAAQAFTACLNATPFTAWSTA